MSRPIQLAVAADRRISPRFSTALRGKVFPGALDCTITNLSLGGARLRFAQPCILGDELLLVDWESGRAYDGQVVWSIGDEMGLRFLRSCHLDDRTPLPFAEAKAQWVNREDGPSRA